MCTFLFLTPVHSSTAQIYIDRRERLCLINSQSQPGWKCDASFQCFVHLLVDAVIAKKRRGISEMSDFSFKIWHLRRYKTHAIFVDTAIINDDSLYCRNLSH